MGAADVWDEQAERFDDEPDHGLRNQSVRSAWAKLLLPLMPFPSARVADIGCGTGSVSLLLAEAGHSISGVDISPAMVARAREKFAASDYDADLSVGDAASPPWASGSFDVVLTRHVLWAMDDPDAALARWLDLLAPAGILILVEGLWWTGAGMRAADVTELVRRHRAEATVLTLDDPALWGAPISDERFLVLSRT